MDPNEKAELERLLAELEVVEIAEVTEATEGSARADGDGPDADNIVWGNI